MNDQPKKLSVKLKVKQAEKKLEKNLNSKKCIICNDPAEFCMRGIPNNVYCRDCALEYFKFLNYLEKL